MNITWDISNKCNLCCKHCGQWNFLIDAEEPSGEENIIIANNLTKIATNVTLLGGEPFLAPAIEDVCRIFYENNISVDLITNGQIYNQTVERIFSLENVKNIYISLDGFEDDNDEVRGKGTWKKGVDFLNKALEWKSLRESIGISTVLTQKSIRHLDKFLEYFNSTEIDAISFNLLDIIGNAYENKAELILDDQLTLSVLELISSYINKVKFTIHIDSGSSYVDKYLHYLYGYDYFPTERRCDALYNTGFCDINGFYYPCRQYHDVGIDLKQEIDWNLEYQRFSIFLNKLLLHDEFLDGSETEWCPLMKWKPSPLDLLAKQKLDALPIPNYKITHQIIFQEINEQKLRYFIIFCKTNEFVEFTKEGFAIYKMVDMGYRTIEIVSEIGCSVDDVVEFLDMECTKGRMAIWLEK